MDGLGEAALLLKDLDACTNMSSDFGDHVNGASVKGKLSVAGWRRFFAYVKGR